jgi:hypothetical protein
MGKFDTDRVGVAIPNAVQLRLTSVPCLTTIIYELIDLTLTGDVVVTAHT